MAIIYLVGTGEYSSYGIQAVFDDERLAQRYATLVDGTIEQFELNAEAPLVRLDRFPFEVRYYLNTARTEAVWSHKNLEKAEAGTVERFPNVNPHKALKVYVMARDTAEAIKIASEKRGIYLAQIMGLT